VPTIPVVVTQSEDSTTLPAGFYCAPTTVTYSNTVTTTTHFQLIGAILDSWISTSTSIITFQQVGTMLDEVRIGGRRLHCGRPRTIDEDEDEDEEFDEDNLEVEPDPILIRANQERMARETRIRERTARLTAAKEKAKALLFRFLDEENQCRYENEGRIYFHGSNGQRYRLSNECATGNVCMINEAGNVTARFCAHPDTRDENGWALPIEDILLAQMFLIQNDAEEFHRIANPY